MSTRDTIRPAYRYEVQCDRCKALHLVLQMAGDALACMDRLNNTCRPCPGCGARERWILRRAQDTEQEAAK